MFKSILAVFIKPKAKKPYTPNGRVIGKTLGRNTYDPTVWDDQFVNPRR